MAATAGAGFWVHLVGDADNIEAKMCQHQARGRSQAYRVVSTPRRSEPQCASPALQ